MSKITKEVATSTKVNHRVFIYMQAEIKLTERSRLAITNVRRLPPGRSPSRLPRVFRRNIAASRYFIHRRAADVHWITQYPSEILPIILLSRCLRYGFHFVCRRQASLRRGLSCCNPSDMFDIFGGGDDNLPYIKHVTREIGVAATQYRPARAEAPSVESDEQTGHVSRVRDQGSEFTGATWCRWHHLVVVDLIRPSCTVSYSRVHVLLRRQGEPARCCFRSPIYATIFVIKITGKRLQLFHETFTTDRQRLIDICAKSGQNRDK